MTGTDTMIARVSTAAQATLAAAVITLDLLATAYLHEFGVSTGARSHHVLVVFTVALVVLVPTAVAAALRVPGAVVVFILAQLVVTAYVVLVAVHIGEGLGILAAAWCVLAACSISCTLSGEGVVQVGEQVVDVLDADGQPHEIRGNFQR